MGDPNLVKRVLVVDDDQTTLAVETDWLRGMGYVVESTTNPNAAVEIVRERPPDLLITDEWMPEMNGAFLIGLLRGLGYTFPVIIATGLLDRGGSLGNHRALAKPFEMADLEEAVTTLIGPPVKNAVQ